MYEAMWDLADEGLLDEVRDAIDAGPRFIGDRLINLVGEIRARHRGEAAATTSQGQELASTPATSPVGAPATSAPPPAANNIAADSEADTSDSGSDDDAVKSVDSHASIESK